MRIRISGLSSGLHQYNFSVPPATLELAGNFSEPVVVEATLDKTARQIYLRAKIATSGVFPCDRCTDDFRLRIATGYAVFYVYDDLDSGRYSPDEVEVISQDTTHLELVRDVREVVLVSVPLKLLCKEDCKGLCPRCGTNRNIQTCDCKEDSQDPRWQGLQRLLKD